MHIILEDPSITDAKLREVIHSLDSVIGKKNVVFLLYAHWCGHCQHFMQEPNAVWGKLVQMFKPKRNVTLIQIEHAMLERILGYPKSRLAKQIQAFMQGGLGFPSLYFVFPRDNKPILPAFLQFQSERTLQNCQSFINLSVAHSQKAAKSKPKQ